MKRYLVTGHEREGDKWPERLKEIEEGLRKTAFDPVGEGRIMSEENLKREASFSSQNVKTPPRTS